MIISGPIEADRPCPSWSGNSRVSADDHRRPH
jgi:hypothetical protein